MPFQAICSVSSRTQADEISLVLQSLGIDVRVFHAGQTAQAVQAVSDESGEHSRWLVLVETSQSAKARQVLAEEEALSPLVSSTPRPMMSSTQRDVLNDLLWLFGLVLINIGIWSMMEHYGGSQNRTTLLQFGAITSVRLSAGEWWRLVTALFVHIGVRHLVANMAVLVALGALTLRAWGPGRFFFVYVLSGVLGNLAGFAFGSSVAIKAGASGAILGLLGALAGVRLRQLSQPHTHSRFKRWHVVAMVLALYSFVGGVQHPTTDHIAHLGGLIGGVLAAIFLPPFSDDHNEER